MEITKYLQAINLTDPEAMINALQEFFNKINSAKMEQGFELVSLYSTASILEVNGLNKDSVKIIKRAIRAKVDALYSRFPSTMSEVKLTLGSLVEADQEFHV